MSYQAWKCILRPGRFWVQRSDGGTHPVEFTADDVRGFHAGGRQMLDRGFPVPVPLDHDDQAGPVSSADRNAAVVRNNAGWVGDYRLDEGADGPELWARLDIDGPVGMSAADVPDWIEKRVKFVSPSLWPEITLGDGTDVKLGIKHVALTCQPIDFAQKPFGVALSAAGESVPLWSAAPVAVDLAWVNQPGPRSHNRWVNDETGRVVYSKTKPGSTKERIAAAEGDVDQDALRKALDPHKRHELTAGQKNRARQAWDMLTRHHGDKAMHRVREMALADVEAIGRGETRNANGANLYARLEAYRHMMELAGQPAAAETTPAPQSQPAAQPAAAAINLRDPQALADAVHEAGLKLPHAINGDVPKGKLEDWESHKPFISDLYDAMKDRLGGASLDDFKKGLAAANQAGTLELSRLDLSNLAHAQGKDAYGRSEIGGGQDTKHVVNVNSKAARKRQPAATPATGETPAPKKPAARKPKPAKAPSWAELTADHVPTTQPGQPEYEAAAKAVRTAYGSVRGQDGLATAHDLYAAAKRANPSLTPATFKDALVGMQQGGEAELHTRNEVRSLTPEQASVTPFLGDRAKGFVVLKAGKEAPAAKPAAQPKPKATPQEADAAAATVQKLWDNITDKSVTIEKIDAGIQSLADANLAPARLKELARSVGVSRPLPSAAEALKAIRLQLRNRKGTFVRANLSHGDRKTKMSHAGGRTVVAATVRGTKRPARVQLSHGANPMADEPEDDLFTDSELEGEDDAPAEDEAGEGEEEGTSEDSELIQQLADAMASLGLVVEPGKTLQEFAEHLLTAVNTHKATRDGGTPQVDDAAAQPEPEPMSMSMNAEVAQLKKRVERAEATAAAGILKEHMRTVAQLERAGVSPERCKRWKQTLQAKQLSLAGGTPDGDVGKVLAEMEMAKEAFAEKIQMSMAREESEPDWAKWNKADDDPAATRKRQEDLGDELAALAGASRRK